MADKTEYFVAGYHFATADDAKQAQLEQKKSAYFESRLAGKDAHNRLAVYDKILDEKVFMTPAGWEYLKKMQEELRLLGVEEEQIRPIPMYVTFIHNDEGTVVRQRVKPVKKRDKAKERFGISLMMNLILAVMVVAMFVISLDSQNLNILNYKKNIENKYAAWEQELTERENRIRRMEAQMENAIEPETKEK